MSYSETPDAIDAPDDEEREDAAVDAEPDNDEDDGVDRSKWPEIHKDALLEYERAWERDRMNIEEAYDDLRFRRGRVSDQWDAVALSARVGRPVHVNNKIPKFIRQVTGDQRQMRPSIEVVPVDSNADVDIAEIRAGIVRYVENRSHAKYIYNQGGDSQVTCGIGHWEVETEYANATTFNQEIRIALIEDGVAVLWDADSNALTREDAEHCFVPIDKTTAKFKWEWPDATASGFDTSLCGTGTSAAFDTWAHDDYIRIVKYWKKKPKKRMLALLPDGSVDDLTEQFDKASPQEAKAAMSELRKRGVRVERRDSYEICRYLLTAHEILEEKTWKGMHIPVVPVVGEEIRIGREVYRTGLCRPVKDLQKMVNYYASAETEIVALQPKAPFLGTKKMFQDRYDLWDTANTENHPFLEYTPDPQAAGQKPERIKPPVASEAIQQGAINAANDMKEVLGIYDSNLGAKSNEQSGVAIKARDQQGDTGTFIYIDNMALAIQRTGIIVNDLIPHVYDTERQMRILGNDGKRALKTINQAAMVEGKSTTINDMSVGAYDVEIEQGPSYTTKREQARDGMTEFIRAVPQAAPLIGDLIAEVMDWPKAREIGERLQEMLPPPIKQKLEQEQAEREQSSGKPPKPPSPQEQQAMQQAAQAKQQQEALQQEEIQLKMAEQKAKTEKMQAEARKANAEADRAEVEAQIMQQQLAAKHMDQLRAIEAHDHDIEGTVQGRQHAQDAHEVGMTHQGLDAASKMQAQQQAEQQAQQQAAQAAMAPAGGAGVT